MDIQLTYHKLHIYFVSVFCRNKQLPLSGNTIMQISKDFLFHSEVSAGNSAEHTTHSHLSRPLLCIHSCLSVQSVETTAGNIKLPLQSLSLFWYCVCSLFSPKCSCTVKLQCCNISAVSAMYIVYRGSKVPLYNWHILYVSLWQIHILYIYCFTVYFRPYC